MRPLLGTYVEIGVESSVSAPEPAIAAAFDAVAEVQLRLSFHDARSDLTRLNQSNGSEVLMHPLSIRVLRLARAMTCASGGLFNCTVGGALVGLGVLPDHGSGGRLDCGSAEDIQLQWNKARLRRPVLVTLDGIAKGYAVDYAIKSMQRHGVTAGWVNAGGDLRVFGDMVLPVRQREIDGRYAALG
ncbi:MAG: FAD:protein FMN transferase, partial [Methylotenera sp.]